MACEPRGPRCRPGPGAVTPGPGARGGCGSRRTRSCSAAGSRGGGDTTRSSCSSSSTWSPCESPPAAGLPRETGAARARGAGSPETRGWAGGPAAAGDPGRPRRSVPGPRAAWAGRERRPRPRAPGRSGGGGGPPARRRRWPRAALWEPGGRCGAPTGDLGARRVPVLRGVGAQGPREPDNLAPPAGEEAQPRGVSAAAATRRQGPVSAAGGRRQAGERPRAGPRSDRGWGRQRPAPARQEEPGPETSSCGGPARPGGAALPPLQRPRGEGRLPGDMGGHRGGALRTCRPSCPGP